jgi:hypothetical protein
MPAYRVKRSNALRKAALFAAERGEAIPMKLRNTDIDQAIN